MNKVLCILKNQKVMICISILLLLVVCYKLNNYNFIGSDDILYSGNRYNFNNDIADTKYYLFPSDEGKNLAYFSLYIIFITYISIILYEKFIKLTNKLNPKQRIIIAVLVPIILYITFYPFMYNVSHKVTAFNKTWTFWVFYILIIGFFEYKLFDNQVNKRTN